MYECDLGSRPVTDTASAVEVTANLGNLNAHHLEVEPHTAHALPLNGGNVHTVDRPSNLRSHLNEEDSGRAG